MIRYDRFGEEAPRNPPWYDGRPAPLDGCKCAVCLYFRGDRLPVRCKPSDPEWPRLLRLAQERTK